MAWAAGASPYVLVWGGERRKPYLVLDGSPFRFSGVDVTIDGQDSGRELLSHAPERHSPGGRLHPGYALTTAPLARCAAVAHLINNMIGV